jgi:hypothetical protein
MTPANDPTVARTPCADCPACQERRRHTVREWKEFHPLAGCTSEAAAATGGVS